MEYGTKLLEMTSCHGLGSEKNLAERTNERDYGALESINAAIELRNSFQNLKDRVISDWKIDGGCLDFNIKCGINTG